MVCPGLSLFIQLLFRCHRIGASLAVNDDAIGELVGASASCHPTTFFLATFHRRRAYAGHCSSPGATSSRPHACIDPYRQNSAVQNVFKPAGMYLPPTAGIYFFVVPDGTSPRQHHSLSSAPAPCSPHAVRCLALPAAPARDALLLPPPLPPRPRAAP